MFSYRQFMAYSIVSKRYINWKIYVWACNLQAVRSGGDEKEKRNIQKKQGGKYKGGTCKSGTERKKGRKEERNISQ